MADEALIFDTEVEIGRLKRAIKGLQGVAGSEAGTTFEVVQRSTEKLRETLEQMMSTVKAQNDPLDEKKTIGVQARTKRQMGPQCEIDKGAFTQLKEKIMQTESGIAKQKQALPDAATAEQQSSTAIFLLQQVLADILKPSSEIAVQAEQSDVPLHAQELEARGLERIRSNANLARKRQGHAIGTLSAPRGRAWVGERGPELVEFSGGERVYTATQSAARTTVAGEAQSIQVINYNRIDASNIEQVARLAELLNGERRSMRMGYAGR